MARSRKAIAGRGGAVAPRRILAGFGPIADEVRTIETALSLARALGVEIAGHFVEESRLIDLAGLPFAKAFRPSGRAALPIEVAAMEREFAQAAATWRRALSIRADRSRIAVSYRMSRGDYCAEIAREAASTDIVVINQANLFDLGGSDIAAVLAAFKQAAGTVLLPSSVASAAKGPVVMIAAGAVPAPETLRLAERVALTGGTELAVAVLADGKPDFDAVVAAARETLGPGTRVQWIPGTDLAAAGALVADLAPSFVVWPSGNRPMSEQEADWLLRTARTPLLLMR